MSIIREKFRVPVFISIVADCQSIVWIIAKITIKEKNYVDQPDGRRVISCCIIEK